MYGLRRRTVGPDNVSRGWINGGLFPTLSRLVTHTADLPAHVIQASNNGWFPPSDVVRPSRVGLDITRSDWIIPLAQTLE